MSNDVVNDNKQKIQRHRGFYTTMKHRKKWSGYSKKNPKFDESIDARFASFECDGIRDAIEHQNLMDSGYLSPNDLTEVEENVDRINRFLSTAIDDEWHQEIMTEMISSTRTPFTSKYSHVFLASFEDLRRHIQRDRYYLNGTRRKTKMEVIGKRIENGIVVSELAPAPGRTPRKPPKCKSYFGQKSDGNYCHNKAKFFKKYKGGIEYRCLPCMSRLIKPDGWMPINIFGKMPDIPQDQPVCATEKHCDARPNGKKCCTKATHRMKGTTSKGNHFYYYRCDLCLSRVLEKTRKKYKKITYLTPA